MKNKRILQLGKFFPIRGGVEKVMYDLMLGLSASGVICDMLCATTENHTSGVFPVNEYSKLIVVPTTLKFAATMVAPAMITTLRKIARNYDLIHIHHPDPMACLALFLSGFTGKVVLHWHSDILKQKKLLILYKPLQNWLIRRADIIVGTTPVYVQESSFLKHVQNKIDFIPIGVLAIEATQNRIDEIRRQYKNKRLIFSLGRLVEYKGYEYLIKAAHLLDDSYHIVIGGKGPLMNTLSELVERLGLVDRVTLLGFVTDEDAAAYFLAADVFCLSSIFKTEAFAIVQIEAMSCGKPIVSTHIPGSGVSWVNQHEFSGIVVPTEDPIALSFALQRIFKEGNLYENLSIGSLRRYQSNFTRECMINKAFAIYDRVFAQTKI